MSEVEGNAHKEAILRRRHGVWYYLDGRDEPQLPDVA